MKYKNQQVGDKVGSYTVDCIPHKGRYEVVVCVSRVVKNPCHPDRQIVERKRLTMQVNAKLT